MVKGKEKKIITNTAYLLNTWFPKNTMWKGVRGFIRNAHNEHWEHKNTGLVEVRFRIIKRRREKELVT